MRRRARWKDFDVRRLFKFQTARELYCRYAQTFTGYMYQRSFHALRHLKKLPKSMFDTNLNCCELSNNLKGAWHSMDSLN